NDGFCSGTLVTPTVVLTAKHCIAGYPSRNWPGHRTGIAAVVGQTGRYKSHAQATDVAVAVIGLDWPFDEGQYGLDAAIVYLDPNDPALEAKIVRPSL